MINELMSLNEEKILKYDSALQKAYHLLTDETKQTLIHVLEHCGIPRDVQAVHFINGMDFNRISNENKNMIIYASKGNLKICQNMWSQSTGNIASTSRIYKDLEAEQHICVILKHSVPQALLRSLYLNNKKIVPVILTLYGYEPYNILDIAPGQLATTKVNSLAISIMYQEKYKTEIEFILSLPPYRAGNAFYILASKINLRIQMAIQDILMHGVVLSAANIVTYSFDPICEATKDLTIKYQDDDTTPEEKDKISKYIALYFAELEKATESADKYIDSLYSTYEIQKST